ncbi:MAG: ABC transporter permease [Lachnospiraceae bacterium]|nr:ABC transporter permease [Lachnospiraceae bacterium]
MINLLKIEFYKLKKFKLGYIAVIFMFVVGYMYGYKIGTEFFETNDNTAVVFSNTVCDTSLVFIIAIVTALFIGKGFSNRTICNEIKLGYSRFHVLFSKMTSACILAALLHFTYIISTVLAFSIVRGFDASVLSPENALWLLTVLIQMTAIISGVILISFTTKKLSESIALSAICAAVCCNILRNYTDAKIFTMSPFCFVLDNNVENLVFSGISALVTMVVFLTIAIFTFRKAEIK